MDEDQIETTNDYPLVLGFILTNENDVEQTVFYLEDQRQEFSINLLRYGAQRFMITLFNSNPVWMWEH